MFASAFYHDLHIVQLKILSEIAQEKSFLTTANNWSSYKNKNFNRYYAFIHKVIFKIFYY